jgi:hypothetical protein
MKTSIGVLCVALAVGGGLAFSHGQDPKQDQAQDQKGKDAPKDDGAKRMELLESDLVSTRKRCEGLAGELSETKATLAKVVHYLDAQATSAASLQDALAASEAAGFTAGINPNSREILLAGWREMLGTQQRDVPAMPVTPLVEPPKKPGAKSDATDTPK